MPQAREATKEEIREGNALGRIQRAERVVGESAIRLNPETRLILSDINPGGVIPGASKRGKTETGVKPVLESHLEVGDSIIVCDIKGDLMESTAAYARALGYKIYVFAPGIEYPDKYTGRRIQISDGLNFADFLEGPEDTDGTLEITRALNLNMTKDPDKRHEYFGPQGDAAQETTLLTAKLSPSPDILTSWELLGLDRLAERLQTAYEENRMNGDDLPYYVQHRSRGMRAIAKDKGSSNPGPTIQSTASQLLNRFISPKIAKCLLKTTIPLDLTGKTIVYFRIDEDNLQATAPLVATALHMLIRRNISNIRKRENHLVLIADEASQYPLPALHEWAALSRSNGFVAWLAYQQETQMKYIYGDKWEIIRANLPTRIYFDQGDKKCNELIAKDLDELTIVAAKKGYSFSSGSNNHSSSDDFQKVSLLSAAEIGRMTQKGQCIIVSPGYKNRPIIYKDKPIPFATKGTEDYPELTRNIVARFPALSPYLMPYADVCDQRRRFKAIWKNDLVPKLQEQHENNFGEIDVKQEIQNRTELANILLPEPEIQEEEQMVEALASAASVANIEQTQQA